MKLQDIHLIEEGRQFIDGPFHKKIMVLDDPSAVAVLALLNKVRDTLGGWSGPQGVQIWNRDEAEHALVAKAFGVNTKRSIGFYINPSEIDPKTKEVIDFEFDASEFSGVDDRDGLEETPLIRNMMRLVAKRKDAMQPEPEDDFSDLLNSLSGNDY